MFAPKYVEKPFDDRFYRKFREPLASPSMSAKDVTIKSNVATTEPEDATMRGQRRDHDATVYTMTLR